MLYFMKEKLECTGCGACAIVCPKQCITMEKDEEGFLYPVASDSCIHCGKCERVCPSFNDMKDERMEFPQMAYCAVTKDKITWRKSASGGAFSEICNAFAEEDTMICGAAWDGFLVHHICVMGKKEIEPLRKSKYIASDTEQVFAQIKEHLKKDKKVIFCGTPCQVAGLKKTLECEYDKLLLIDLICHGVGSPDVFQAAMKIIGEQFNSSVLRYEFRAKKRIYHTDYLARIFLEDGRNVFLLEDPYIQLFLKQICLRPSCGANCKYRTEVRMGDITIADFKELSQVFPKFRGTKLNYSTVVINTEKGMNILNDLKKYMQIIPSDLHDVKKYNPLFHRQTWFSEERDVFFAEFIENPLHAVERRTKAAVIHKRSLRGKIYDLLPVCLRKYLAQNKR